VQQRGAVTTIRLREPFGELRAKLRRTSVAVGTALCVAVTGAWGGMEAPVLAAQSALVARPVPGAEPARPAHPADPARRVQPARPAPSAQVAPDTTARRPTLTFADSTRQATLGRAYKLALHNLLDINTVAYDAATYDSTGFLADPPGTFVRAGGGYDQPWTRDASVNTWNAGASSCSRTRSGGTSASGS
jgi:hypothetical protein